MSGMMTDLCTTITVASGETTANSSATITTRTTEIATEATLTWAKNETTTSETNQMKTTTTRMTVRVTSADESTTRQMSASLLATMLAIGWMSD